MAFLSWNEFSGLDCNTKWGDHGSKSMYSVATVVTPKVVYHWPNWFTTGIKNLQRIRRNLKLFLRIIWSPSIHFCI